MKTFVKLLPAAVCFGIAAIYLYLNRDYWLPILLITAGVCSLPRPGDTAKTAGKPACFLVIVWDDVEPEIIGSYSSPDAMDAAAIKLRKQHGGEHGIYRVLVSNNVPKISAYSGSFFDVVE